MLLGIMRTRFNVNDKLRKNIIESINDEVSVGIVFPSNEKCVIEFNTNEYTDNLVLSINVDNGNLYSWDNETYKENNKIVVNRAGTYTGYFIDKAGGTGNCEISVVSKNQYSYRECEKENINYGDWYVEDSYGENCETISKDDAENDNSNLYRVCQSVDTINCNGSSTCYKIKTYKRNATSCSWKNEQWNISNDLHESSAIVETRTKTVYKVK